MPGVGDGTKYKYAIAARSGSWREKADPLALATELAARDRLGRCHRSQYDLERCRLGDGADPASAGARADEHLRGAPRLVAAGAVLPASWRPSSPSTSRDLGFTHVEFLPVAEHPFGGSWGYQVTSYYAPTSRFGSPDDFRYLVDALHRPASACSWTGCPRTSRGTNGRWRGSTAPHCTSTKTRGAAPARLGHARLQLRPDRGAQLPGRQRRLLAGGLPHRRAARRRGGVHAVPRLLAQGRRVDPEPVRRAGEPRGRFVSAGGQRHHLQARARHHDHRRGVDLVARRDPAGLPGRARVRLQVGHGLDARHPQLREPGSHLPPVPPQRDDVLDDVRVLGELHPAGVATTRWCTGRAR